MSAIKLEKWNTFSVTVQVPDTIVAAGAKHSICASYSFESAESAQHALGCVKQEVEDCIQRMRDHMRQMQGISCELEAAIEKEMQG
jgi:hypothetical protein